MSDIQDNEDRSDTDQDVFVTVRALMSKEVGNIIGKKAETLKYIKEESGARVRVSDGSFVERILTVSGNVNAIVTAYSIITVKVKEFNDRAKWLTPNSPLVIKLIVPTKQCGYIIGKGGSKIKEIKNTSKATINVSFDMLPNCTERLVTITGTPETVTDCIKQVCIILANSPYQGEAIPYQPQNPVAPVSNGSNGGGFSQFSGPDNQFNRYDNSAGYYNSNSTNSGHITNTLLSNLSNSLGTTDINGIEKSALAAIASSNLLGMSGKQKPQNVKTQRITVPNEFVGIIIGRGGNKIAEISRISGATIQFNDEENRNSESDGERSVNITGTPDAITIAKTLINMSIDLRKAHIEAEQNNEDDNDEMETSNAHFNQTRSFHPNNDQSGSANPLLQLLSKPDILNSLSNLLAIQNNSSGSNLGNSRMGQSGGNFQSRSRMHDASSGKSKPYRNSSFTPY